MILKKIKNFIISKIDFSFENKTSKCDAFMIFIIVYFQKKFLFGEVVEIKKTPKIKIVNNYSLKMHFLIF